MSNVRGGRNLPYHGGPPDRGRGRGGDRGGDRGRGDRGRGGPPSGGGFRGGGGRGGGPKEPDVDPSILYQSVPKVNKEVEQFEDKCIAQNKGQRASPGQLALRPGYGTSGTPVILRSNFFEAIFNSPKWMSHKVKIKPDPQNLRLRREVFIELMGKDELKAAHAATDGAQEIVAMKDLTVYSPMKITLDANLKGAKEFQIELSRGELGEPSKLVTSLQNPSLRQQTPEELTTIRLMNILMSAHPFRDPGVVTIKGANGTKVFWTDNRKQSCYLEGGIECIRGFNSSVRICDNRILVNLGINHSSFFVQGPLANIFTKFKDVHQGDTVLLNRYINRLRVDVTHLSKRMECGVLVYRQRSIWGLANAGRDGYDPKTDFRKPIDANPPKVPHLGATADQVQFYKYDKDKEGNNLATGRYISITEYFKTDHKMALKYHDWPVVNIGSFVRPVYLPLDVCIVPAGQRFMGELALIQRQNIIAFSCRKPPANYQSITQGGLKIMGMSANQTDALGIRFHKEMVAVPGRILPTPTLKYGKQTLVPRFGAWNLRDQIFCAPVTIKSWAAYVFHKPRQEPRGDVPGAFLSLAKEGRKQGMKWPDLARDPISVELADKPRDWIEQVNGVFKSLLNKPIDIVVIALPPGVDRIFDHIKWISETKAGILTHCCLANKLIKADSQYLANNAMKVNLKLGGVNQTLNAPPRLIQSKNTMVVGLDVTHPSPTDPEKFPSMATIVASTNASMGQWPGEVRVQEPRQEKVEHLKSMMLNRLHRWKKENKVFPANILIYRDGVSEGQYKMVLDQELPLVKNAVQSVYPDKQPNITIVVASKRHNVRFYPTKASDADRSDGPKNGMVVDRHVTRSIYWDFYMQAQAPLQGSARPAHYIVIWDEIFGAANSDPKPADSLQELTHSICYMMGRCTRSISYATPAFLADKFCDRARRYMRAYFYRCENMRERPDLADPTKLVRLFGNANESMVYI